MTYGLQVLNQFGDDVFRDGRCLFVKERGVCFKQTGGSRVVAGCYPATAAFGNSYGWYPLARSYSRNDVGGDDLRRSCNAHFHWAGPGVEASYSAPGDTKEKILISAASDISDQVFFEMHANGLVAQTQFWYDLTPDIAPRKIAGVCVPAGAADHTLPVRYFVASHSGLPALTEDHGLIVKNEAGGVLYDSRHENVRVRDFFNIPFQDVQDVLENDAVKTYTPRQPIQNPYIASSLNWSVRITNGGDYYYPRLSWDGFSLIMDRLKIDADTGNAAFIYRGFTVTIADPEL